MPSTKLSVTLNRRLEAKYDAAALREIAGAVEKWVAADSARGIETIHVALDDAKAMARHKVAPVTAKAGPEAVKKAIDALWAKLSPAYLVLLGGPDVVPFFDVPNPSYDAAYGDTDVLVSTDNPYACSTPFRAKDRNSYLVPDRVVGRIADLPSERDPGLLLESLATATGWASLKKEDYEAAYAVCCDEWKESGAQCVAQVGGAGALLLSPPEKDGAAPSKARLESRFHLIKCHGAQINPNFYGQKGTAYPTILSSATLDQLAAPQAVVGAMCCYGAQVFSPKDPAVEPTGAWPISATYLRHGAYGFFGSTKIAWVGKTEMTCADRLVSSWLGKVRSGASLGRASLEARQEYLREIQEGGRAPAVSDEKTLLEYVLLGDPAIQPVKIDRVEPPQGVAVAAMPLASVDSPAVVAARTQRRVVRARDAEEIRRFLPARRTAPKTARDRSAALFASVVSGLFDDGAAKFGVAPEKPLVHKVSTTLDPGPVAAGMARRAIRAAAPPRRDALQYCWSGRRVVEVDGVAHTQIRLVRVETDVRGAVLDRSVVESA